MKKEKEKEKEKETWQAFTARVPPGAACFSRTTGAVAGCSAEIESFFHQAESTPGVYAVCVKS